MPFSDYWQLRWRGRQTALARGSAAAIGVAILLSTSGCGGGTSPSDVAKAAGAQSCDSSGYGVISQITSKKQTIYDCTFGDGTTKCVTYANDIANDSTALVRLLFQNKLGSGKPSCLD